MRDFLTSLLGATRAAAPALKPRLPSRYAAPEPGLAGGLLADVRPAAAEGRWPAGAEGRRGGVEDGLRTEDTEVEVSIADRAMAVAAKTTLPARRERGEGSAPETQSEAPSADAPHVMPVEEEAMPPLVPAAPPRDATPRSAARPASRSASPVPLDVREAPAPRSVEVRPSLDARAAAADREPERAPAPRTAADARPAREAVSAGAVRHVEAAKVPPAPATIALDRVAAPATMPLDRVAPPLREAPPLRPEQQAGAASPSSIARAPEREIARPIAAPRTALEVRPDGAAEAGRSRAPSVPLAPAPERVRAVTEARPAAVQAADITMPAAEPPVVRISIGRIDVRVTQPAATPARAPARPAAGMSLEAYLQRREGGSR